MSRLVLLALCSSCFAEEAPQKRCLSQLAHPEEPRCNVNKPSAPKLYVFVSLSMPEASLKALSQQAEQYNAVLVLKGLYEDSFVKTALKLNGITVQINPDLFEKYHVTSVPSFIQVRNDKELHRLSGNVTLDFCASKFAEGS